MRILSACIAGPASWRLREAGEEHCFTYHCPAFWRGDPTNFGCPTLRVSDATSLGDSSSYFREPCQCTCSQPACWRCCLCCILHGARWDDEILASRVPAPTRSAKASWTPSRRITIASRRSWWVSSKSLCRQMISLGLLLIEIENSLIKKISLSI